MLNEALKLDILLGFLNRRTQRYLHRVKKELINFINSYGVKERLSGKVGLAP